MAHNADKLGPLGRATVQELGWAQRDVISVPPEMAAIDAMRKMQVAAVADCTFFFAALNSTLPVSQLYAQNQHAKGTDQCRFETCIS